MSYLGFIIIRPAINFIYVTRKETNSDSISEQQPHQNCDQLLPRGSHRGKLSSLSRQDRQLASVRVKQFLGKINIFISVESSSP